MTIIHKFEKKCAVCGETSLQPHLASTSAWGYPDLDLRPPEMQRSTINAWILECPCCGYVAIDIEKEDRTSSDFLKTEEYLTCEDHDFKSDLSKRFYRHYLISKANKDHELEFYSLMYCAWTCDDAEDELAVEIRKLALKSMDKIELECNENKNNLLIVKADLLRRTQQFNRLISEFKGIFMEDELQNEIITFEIELAMEKDSDCHTMEKVVKKIENNI